MRLSRLLLFVAAVVPVGASAADACPALLDYTLPSLMDRPTALCQFRGKVVLIVNTASECGYTPQYQGLEALYRRYRDRGLVVLGFPANDFGGQEPGGNKEIAHFCEVNYGVSFPMFAKSTVAPGKAINPFYEALAARTGQRPQWNFHKYLVDRSGERVLSFASGVEPDDRRLVSELERMLGDGPR